MAHVVTVLPFGMRVPVRDGETIERAMNRSGYVHRHRGCRRGGCGVCVADLVSGEAYHERPVAESVLSRKQLDGGAVLICRAVPTTDVVIHVRDNVLRLISPLQLQLAEREVGRPSPALVPTPEGN